MTLPGINDWNAWHTGFRRFFQHNQHANQAYCALLAVGCNPLFLARFSYYAAIATASPLDQSRDKLRQFAGEISRSIPKIEASIALLEDLNRKATELCAPIEQFALLPEQLLSYIRSLKFIRRVLRKHGSKRRPNTSDHFLLLLHVYVTMMAGGPQWSGLAYLLEAAHEGHGKDTDVGKDAIRQKVNGLITSGPRRYMSAKKQIENYLAAGNGNWFLPGEIQGIEKAAIDTFHSLSENPPPNQGANPKATE